MGGFNPLDYVDGKALGKHLKSNKYQKPKKQRIPTTVIADPAQAKKAVSKYAKGKGRPD